MTFSSRNLLVTLVTFGSVAAVVIACGSEGSTFDDGAPPVGVFTEGGFGDGGTDPGDDLYANDPPPQYCGPETGAPSRPPITGTLDCPDDKNKPGCSCATAGQTAPCWTGLRKNRGLGICADGVATCRPISENSNAWSACEGQVLPKIGATGAEACSCFTAGTWKITNTSPCIREQGGNYSAYATSGDRAENCNPPTTPPVAGTIWSTDTLQVDCAGTFRLCFRIRGGDIKNPKPSDCTLGQVCIDAVYPREKEIQQLPDLPVWLGADSECARAWDDDATATVSPGYGEMIVKGQSVTCDAIDDGNGGDFVFNRVLYCPKACRNGANPELQACKDCQLASSGSF